MQASAPYVRTYGVNASITRGANTYGPYQHPEKLIPLFVTNALDGDALPVYGDGRQRREWDEAVRATIDWYRDNRDWWEPIKRSSDFREYYDKQYGARLQT